VVKEFSIPELHLAKFPVSHASSTARLKIHYQKLGYFARRAKLCPLQECNPKSSLLGCLL
jgi:hypothetical protein